MADELGTAVLRLELSTDGLKEGLTKAKQQIETSLRTSPLSLNTKAAQQQFQQLQQTAKTLETQIKALNSTPLNLNRSSLKAAGDEFSRNVKVINDFTRAVINGDRALGNSIASIQQQSRAFSTLAANVKIATPEFVNFTQAAAKASQKQLFTGFEQISALQKLFQSGGSAGIADTFKGTEQLLAFSSKIGQTPAAINLYVSALEQALSVTKTTDVNFAKLTAEIERQAAALTKATNAAKLYSNSTKQPQLALAPGKGPSQFVFQGPSAQDIADEQRNLRRQQKITQRVDYFSTGGASPADRGLLPRPDLEAIQQDRDLATARKRTAAETLKTITTENKQRAQQAAARRKQIGSRVSGAIGSGLIGGGFPLLFGQGAGAAAGGAIGGIGGGAIGGQFGFALSVIGTAIGAAFDTALEKGKTLAAGLDDPIGQFDKLREAALFSSKATEKTVDALIAAGRAEEAKIIAENDLNARFGGAENAKEFADATDRLTRAWTEATVVMAGFVAGPLADFIQRLTNEAQIGPENVLAAQTQSQKFVESQFNPFERSLGVNKTVEFNNKQFTGDAASVYQQITEELIKQKRATDDINKAEAQRASTAVELEAAAKRNLDINKTNLALITAQAAGNRLEALNLRESLVQKEKTRAINLLPAGDTTVQRETIDLNAQKQLVQINAERLNVQRDVQKAAFTEFQTREQIGSGIENTLQLLGTEQGQYRDTLGTIQQISDTIDAARRKEADIGFQIDQARVSGRDEEAARLVDQQRTAALETRQRFVEGARTLKEAGESVRDNLINATQSLQNLKLSNLRFLSPGEQRETLNQLQRDFVAATRERGFTPRITGTRDQIIQEKQAFVDFTRQETQLTKAIDQGNRALIEINTRLSTQFESLASTIPTLTEATTALAAKNWTVSLNVVNNADGSKTINSINSLS